MDVVVEFEVVVVVVVEFVANVVIDVEFADDVGNSNLNWNNSRICNRENIKKNNNYFYSLYNKICL